LQTTYLTARTLTIRSSISKSVLKYIQQNSSHFRSTTSICDYEQQHYQQLVLSSLLFKADKSDYTGMLSLVKQKEYQKFHSMVAFTIQT
jgi:hypothetical protein